MGVSPWASRGVWGHGPPENFGNLDTLRMFLMHSDTCFFNTAYYDKGVTLHRRLYSHPRPGSKHMRSSGQDEILELVKCSS